MSDDDFFDIAEDEGPVAIMFDGDGARLEVFADGSYFMRADSGGLP